MKYVNCATPIRVLSICVVFLLMFSTIAVAQERLSVTASKANIRVGPGTKHKILYQAEKYFPVIVIKKEGNWFLFRDYEHNPAGWVHKSLLGKTSSVAVKKDKCNVRSKPSIKGKILFVALKGVPFKVLDRKGNWVKIKHKDGDIGWISKKLVW